MWLAKCCKIQQLIIFIQQKYLFNFNKNNFIQQKYLFNLYKNNFIQQKYLFNFNKNIYSTSTKTFIQLQPKIISFNDKVPGHSKYRHSTNFPVPPRLNTKQNLLLILPPFTEVCYCVYATKNFTSVRYKQNQGKHLS